MADAEGGIAAFPADPSAPIEPYVTLRPGALALLALCVQLFPLADFRHVILTPTVLLIADVLSASHSPACRRVREGRAGRSSSAPLPCISGLL